MTGLGTNILIRYLTQDDPVQSRRATEIVENRLSEDRPGFVNVVTTAEVVWVLGRNYKLGAHEMAAAVERMLQADTLVIQNEQQVFEAMVALRSGRGSFSDALIGAVNEWAGCDTTLTFDKKAARAGGFHRASVPAL